MKNILKNSAFSELMLKGNRDVARSTWTTNYIQKPGAGKIKTVTLIPGYGIGQEITRNHTIHLFYSYSACLVKLLYSLLRISCAKLKIL
jgi:hypothetical protein